MPQPKIKKKTASKITPGVEARTVELSLQHPEFGAKRLIPLLSSEGIDVSASTVYRILKRNGLSSREKRLLRLAERSRRKRRPAARKKPARITDDVAARIVPVSLQNPDCGAKRLQPLLAREGIFLSVSAIYRLLQRNGLQNRARRLARIKQPPAVQPAAAAVHAIPPADAVPPPTWAGEPGLLPAHVEEKVPSPRVLRPLTVPRNSAAAKPWFLTLINAVLLVLILFLGFQTWQNLGKARLKPELIAAISPGPAVAAVIPEAAPPPLSDYRAISKRNLFNVSREQAPVHPEEIAVEEIAPAGKDLGLKLVGTVVADDIRLRRAFIDNSRTRKQEVYREGDAAGEARIKKILRNRVVVATLEGDRLLTVEIMPSGKRPAASPRPQPAAGNNAFSQAAGSGQPEIGVIEARLKRAQVVAGLSEDDHLMKQVRVFPYTDAQGGQQGGFRLSYLMAGNVLVQMGLRSGDVILGLNGEAFAGPDDAAGFFEKLAQGGDVTIQAIRRGRLVQMQLKID